MPDLDAVQERTAGRGGRESIIRHFAIEGLYGYRNISLSSQYAATILIARNGSGKTTLLGALDAFLRMQLSRLRNLQFQSITCEIKGYDAQLVLTHKNIVDFFELPNDGEMLRWSRRISVEPPTLFTFLVDEWPLLRQEPRYAHDSKVFSAFINATDYSTVEARSVCDKLRAALYARIDSISRLNTALAEALANFEVVYLPTYRRVELALTNDKRERSAGRRRSQLNVLGSLFTGNIQFGLSDISDRLAEMNQSILVESNNGYRRISANIINELIDGTFEREEGVKKSRPSGDELELFFSRIERGRTVGPFYPVTIPSIEIINAKGEDDSQSSRFLNYFLNKLGTVIDATHETEAQVEAFILNCNKYLLSPDIGPGMPSSFIRDGKELKLNRKNLKVHVETVPGSRPMPLDALSSGEKQMISLFAKLYLYPKQKLVLIDEPELSLSIDWQRQILVDILNAPSCAQLVAITHSPFVFDNELESYAGSLQLEYGPQQDERVLPLDFDEDAADE